MDDTAANWGVLAAGLGLVVLVATETGIAGWMTPATTVGPVTARQVAAAGFVVAALAFSLVRHGALDRRQAGLGAAGASIVTTLATLVAFFGPEFRAGVAATVGIAVYLTVLAGGLTVALGWALATGIPNDRLYTVARALSVATGIGLAGFLVGTVFRPVRRSRGRGRRACQRHGAGRRDCHRPRVCHAHYRHRRRIHRFRGGRRQPARPYLDRPRPAAPRSP